MAVGKEYPLSLVIKAVDKAGPILDRLGDKLEKMNAPFKAMGKSWDKLTKASGFGKVVDGFTGVGGALKGVASEAFTLGAQFLTMGAAAAFALFAVVRSSVAAGDKLAEMSDRVGLTVDMYASLRYAAGQADIEQDQFNEGIDKFSKSLGQAKANGGPLLEFLNKVSPKMAEQFKNAKGVEAGLSLITTAMERLPDAERRAALGAAAFGKGSGSLWGTFLHQGGPAIQALMKRYGELAGSQELFARGASDLDNQMRDTEAAFEGVRAAAMGALFPAIGELTKAVTAFLVKNREGIKKWADGAAKAITAWVEGGGIERLIKGINDVIDVVGKIWEKIGGFKGSLVIFAAYLSGPLVASILSVIPAVLELGAAILATPVGWVLLIAAAFALAAYEIYSNWGPISQWFMDLTSGWEESLNGFIEFFQGTFTGDMTTAFDGIQKIIFGGGKFWATALDGLIQSYKMMLAPIFKPLEWALEAAGFGSLPTFRDIVGVSPAPGAASASQPQRIEVNFSEMPRGVTVTQDNSSSTPIDMSYGYSMGGS